MRKLIKSLLLCLSILAILLQCNGIAFAGDYENPLIDPYKITEYTELPDNIMNILLLGIDFGKKDYWGSGKKRKIEDCHTDAVMVVAINMDQNTIDLVSLPRDTVTYIPGVKGIYKLNAAVNCAETVEEGLQKTKSAAEWLLGDIKIDYYFAVDMNAMIALGDAIGGVDIDLEMNYTGHSRTRYHKGMQHLDGVGITDYLRARTNATVNYNDIGRTNRQREMMLAIFEKLRSNETLLWSVFTKALSMSDKFFTDITAAVTVKLAVILPTILSIDTQSIGTYVFTGRYRTSNSWNFTFTDQENRLSVIQEVYGVTAEKIPYVSYKYTQWLDDMAGFTSVHYLSVAQQLMEYVNGIGFESLSDAQKEAYTAFELAYHEAASAFQAAAETMSDSDTHILPSTRVALRDAAEACAKAMDYPGDLHWSHDRHYWYNDQYINEYRLNWN